MDEVRNLINQALDLAGDVATEAVNTTREAMQAVDANTDERILLLNKAIENLIAAKAILSDEHI